MSESTIMYECVVSNKLGQDKRQISLSATLPFAVSAYPLKQVGPDQLSILNVALIIIF